jgi:tRNA threonylcarbamoyl adenosine modification protein YeaZ
MQGLILETSTNRSCLILADAGHPLAIIPMDGGEKLSKHLGQEVQDLLARHPGFRADFIAVGNGPGSFTGVRVGAAMGKALAFGWGIPIMGFCSLQAFIPSTHGPFAVLVDAGRGGVYCLQGQKTGNSLQWNEPRLLPPDQIPDMHLISPHPALIEKRIQKSVFPADPDSEVLAQSLCERAPSAARSPLDHFPFQYLSISLK